MPTPSKGPRLGGSPAHERLMLSNLATALFEHGRITTTHAKARRLRPLAEKLITSAKRGDLHARRRVLTVVRDKGVVHTLFAEIGPRFAERPGGYTRITKLGPRKGDNAPMAMIELVEGRTVAQQAVGEAERARGSRFRLPSRRSAGSAVTGVPAAGSVATAVPTEGDIEGAPESGEQPAPLPAEGDVEGGFEPADPEAVGPDAGDIDEPAVPEPAAGAEPTSSAGTEPDPGVDDETTDEANRGEPT